MFQSTHPHGVRLPIDVVVLNVTSFNPRTHMGCDIAFAISKVTFHVFQSTHPHGVRHLSERGIQ